MNGRIVARCGTGWRQAVGATIHAVTETLVAEVTASDNGLLKVWPHPGSSIWHGRWTPIDADGRKCNPDWETDPPLAVA